MKVLVINCGSSSLKYQLIDMEGEKVLCKGLCERIGMESSMITHEANGQKATTPAIFPTPYYGYYNKFNILLPSGSSPKGRDPAGSVKKGEILF